MFERYRSRFSSIRPSRPGRCNTRQPLTHLELNSTKPDAKKRGPKAKSTLQPDMPESKAPQLDLFD